MAKQKDAPRDRRPAADPSDDGKVYLSGKWLIIVVVALAVGGAAFSWWYRYKATHRAAQFWGADAVLIRDAPTVHLITLGSMPADAEHLHDDGEAFPDHYHTVGGVIRVAQRRDISQAPGLIHLRTELLMDRSFQVLSDSPHAADWQTGIEFRSSAAAAPLIVLFSADGRLMLRHPPVRGPNWGIPSERFAEGLETIFADWRREAPR